MRCSKCNKLRHTAKNCTVQEKRCSKSGHLRAQCDSNTPKCANCRQGHDSWSRECPYYQAEVAVCKLRTERGITFREARRLIREGNQATQSAGALANRGIRMLNNTSSSDTYRGYSTRDKRFATTQLDLPSLNQEISTQGGIIYRADQYEEMPLGTQVNSSTQESENIPCNPRRWEQVQTVSSVASSPGLLHPQQLGNTNSKYEEKVEQILNKTQKLETLLHDLIPMMIVLAMSRNIEEKMECIEEIGKKCNVMDKVMNIVSEYGIVSKSSSASI